MRKKFEISVGEPWDFEGPDGQNKILAIMEGIVSGPGKLNWDKEYCLLRVIRPFSLDGELVTKLVAAPRYEGDTLKKMLSTGCEAGIARVREDHRLDAGDQIGPDQVTYCIIGAVNPIKG